MAHTPWMSLRPKKVYFKIVKKSSVNLKDEKYSWIICQFRFVTWMSFIGQFIHLIRGEDMQVKCMDGWRGSLF